MHNPYLYLSLAFLVSGIIYNLVGLDMPTSKPTVISDCYSDPAKEYFRSQLFEYQELLNKAQVIKHSDGKIYKLIELKQTEIKPGGADE